MNRKLHFTGAAVVIAAALMLTGCSGDANHQGISDETSSVVRKETAGGDGVASSGLSDEILPGVGKVIEQGEFYTIYNYENDYTYLYEIYDLNGNCLWRDISYKYEPRINLYDARYIEIHKGAGTNLWYCTYIDLDTLFMSYGSIEDAVYVADGMIGQMFFDESGMGLRLFVPFSYSDYYEEIRLDFYSDTAVPADCLIQISLIEEDKIQIEYLNEECEVSTAIVEINR